MGYQRCRSRSCGRVFEKPLYGDTRKRRREFCNPTCASREQKARQQDELKKDCFRAVNQAALEYRRLPAEKKTDNPSRDIEQLIRRNWSDFPRTKNWITHNLFQKGKANEQDRRK
jgi:hypothetical protein